ncbi:hypothetical protein NIES4071_73810 [Calothrix sp. NIES-4071]|nr:hypothetical protein NIES4071_73810 [Calothrix sp. NIES-4071]BAZ61656.1 hypothetical protein NIES4105_73760 [Calothrix sp. NIES-4105]
MIKCYTNNQTGGLTLKTKYTTITLILQIYTNVYRKSTDLSSFTIVTLLLNYSISTNLSNI